MLDPTYFFVLYALWKQKGKPVASKRERLRAADALAAFRLFPRMAGRLLGAGDDLDAAVEAEETAKQKERELKEQKRIDAAEAAGVDPSLAAPGADADSDNSDSDEYEYGDEDPDDAFSPLNEWTLAKRSGKIASPSMDKLLALTGLSEVKLRAMSIIKEVLLEPHRPKGVKSVTGMNFLFTGNPGCGKTTVAELLPKAMVGVWLWLWLCLFTV
jgi:hypothetical protein